MQRDRSIGIPDVAGKPHPTRAARPALHPPPDSCTVRTPPCIDARGADASAAGR